MCTVQLLHGTHGLVRILRLRGNQPSNAPPSCHCTPREDAQSQSPLSNQSPRSSPRPPCTCNAFTNFSLHKRCTIYREQNPHFSCSNRWVVTSSTLHKSWHRCSSCEHHHSRSSQCQRLVLVPEKSIPHDKKKQFNSRPEVKSWSVSCDHLVERCTLHQCRSCEGTCRRQSRM